MTNATANRVFEIQDSRDGHLKQFETGVFLEGDTAEYVHVSSLTNYCGHNTYPIEQARRIYRVIQLANAETAANANEKN